LQSVQTSIRRQDVDWLRVLLFGGLIAYHLGLLYAPWSPYALKSAHTRAWVEGVLLATHPWRMPILFLISGIACRFAIGKLGAGRLLATRTRQLLPPLLFGVAVLVPIQTYLSVVDNLGYQKHFLAYLPELFLGGHTVSVNGRLVRLDTYAHLWFILYLWAYVIVLAAASRAAPRWLPWAEARLEKLLDGPGMIAWPMALLIALRIALYPRFGLTLGFVDDWYNHALSLSMFLFGFVVARNDRLWARLEWLRWAALILAVASWVGYACLWGGHGAPEGVEKAKPFMHPLYAMEQWTAIVAVLGFGHRWLKRESRAIRYLNGGIFTYYVIHQPAMLLVLHLVKPAGLHGGLEALVVLGGTVTMCALAYEGARNLGWAGALVGARGGRRGAPAPAPRVAPAAG